MQNFKILAIASCLLLASCTNYVSDRTKYDAENASKRERMGHNYNVPGASEMAKPMHVTPRIVTVPVTH